MQNAPVHACYRISNEGGKLVVTLIFNETVLTEELITRIGRAVINSLNAADNVVHVDGQALRLTGTPRFDIGFEELGAYDATLYNFIRIVVKK